MHCIPAYHKLSLALCARHRQHASQLAGLPRPSTHLSTTTDLLCLTDCLPARKPVCPSVWLSLSLSLAWHIVHAKPSFRMHRHLPTARQWQHHHHQHYHHHHYHQYQYQWQKPPMGLGTAISHRRCMFYHNLPAVSVQSQLEATDIGMRHRLSSLIE